MRRNVHLDAQFERVFGVTVDAYWQGVWGLDIPRFDEEILRSEDRTVQEALEQAVTAARHRGVEFRVDAAEFVLYVRYLSTGQLNYRDLDPLRDRLNAARRGTACPA